jgi:hypothetical protein
MRMFTAVNCLGHTYKTAADCKVRGMRVQIDE